REFGCAAERRRAHGHEARILADGPPLKRYTVDRELAVTDDSRGDMGSDILVHAIPPCGTVVLLYTERLADQASGLETRPALPLLQCVRNLLRGQRAADMKALHVIDADRAQEIE